MDMNILLDTKNTKLAEIRTLVETGKKEERKLNETEESNVAKLQKEIEDLDKQIEEKRNLETQKQEKNKNKKMENFSLLKSIRNELNKQAHDDATQELFNLGKEEMRKAGLSAEGNIVIPVQEIRSDILAGTQYQGKEIVATDKWNLVEALRANNVVFKAGAQLITGLKNNVSIPVYQGTSVLWKGEVESAADGAGAFSELTLSPKRLTAYITVSKTFLTQDSIGAETMLMNDLNNAISAKLEATILSAVSGATQPSGVAYGMSTTFSGTTTWAGVVSLESAVDTNNALMGNLAYIVHPTTNGIMKTTAKASNQAIFIKDGTTVNGYPCYVTSNCPVINSDQRIAYFANWSDLVVAQFGSLNITVDPYTNSKNDQIVIVASAYFDFVKRRDVSFAIAGLK